MRVHNVFKCDGCSFIFEEPLKFERIGNIDIQPNREQKTSFTLDDLDKVLAILKYIEIYG